MYPRAYTRYIRVGAYCDNKNRDGLRDEDENKHK